MQNRTTAISGSSGTLDYDANGNLKHAETGRPLIYDAWNRLVNVGAPPGAYAFPVAYQYDALSRRVSETQNGVALEFDLSSAGQALEERVGTTLAARYVWSPVYVDALVLRDISPDYGSLFGGATTSTTSSTYSGGLEPGEGGGYSTNSGGGEEDDDPGDEVDNSWTRLWVVQDANWNVTAVAEKTTGGARVVERYAYDPYGKVSFYNGDLTPEAERGVHFWRYLFQGKRRDFDASLDDFNARAFSWTLSRFVSQDPLGYGAGDANFYRFVGNGPGNSTDPSGMQPPEYRREIPAQDYSLLMRCAICHGNAYYGWANVAADAGNIRYAPLQQRLALEQTNWRRLDAKFKNSVYAEGQLGLGILEAGSGAVATYSGIGSGAGVFVLGHGLDNCASAMSGLSGIDRPTLTYRLLTQEYKLSHNQAVAFEAVLPLTTAFSPSAGNAPASRVVLNAPGGTQTAPARFVRTVQPGERITDLIAEGRAATWVNEAEHAIISLERTGPGRIQRVVVSGGRDGIEFIERGGNLFIEMEGQLVQVRRVIGHTHPRVTGPSQGDLDALRMLGQTRSYIIEIGGEPGGTLIRPR